MALSPQELQTNRELKALLQELSTESPEAETNKFILTEVLGENLLTIMKKGPDFGLSLQLLPPKVTSALLQETQEDLKDFIHDAPNFKALFLVLAKDQKPFFDSWIEKLISLSQNPQDLEDIFAALNQEQRNLIFEAIKVRIPDMIQTSSQFNQAFHYLTEGQRSFVFEAIKTRIPSMIKRMEDLRLVYQYLNVKQRNVTVIAMETAAFSSPYSDSSSLIYLHILGNACKDITGTLLGYNDPDHLEHRAYLILLAIKEFLEAYLTKERYASLKLSFEKIKALIKLLSDELRTYFKGKKTVQELMAELSFSKKEDLNELLGHKIPRLAFQNSFDFSFLFTAPASSSLSSNHSSSHQIELEYQNTLSARPTQRPNHPAMTRPSYTSEHPFFHENRPNFSYESFIASLCEYQRSSNSNSSSNQAHQREINPSSSTEIYSSPSHLMQISILAEAQGPITTHQNPVLNDGAEESSSILEHHATIHAEPATTPPRRFREPNPRGSSFNLSIFQPSSPQQEHEEQDLGSENTTTANDDFRYPALD